MWTRLFLILLWGSFASNVLAQKTGEILIVSPGGIGSSATRLLNAIKPHYPGPIGLDSRIPADLSKYDALMIFRPGGDRYAPWLDSLQQDRFIQYLKAGGRLYVEGADFRNWSGSGNDAAHNQLWDFIGDSSDAVGAMERNVTSVVGVAGEFSEGFNLTESKMAQVGSWFMLNGMQTVLRGESVFGSGADMAWISPDPAIKALLHWPIASDYYDDFLATVVCTYFQLCILEVTKEAVMPALSFDPIRHQVQLPAPGQIVLIDILGRVILEVTFELDRFDIPAHITPGTYIATWTSGEQRAAITISIR